jgi:hypothetical protein
MNSLTLHPMKEIRIILAACLSLTSRLAGWNTFPNHPPAGEEMAR